MVGGMNLFLQKERENQKAKKIEKTVKKMHTFRERIAKIKSGALLARDPRFIIVGRF